MKTENVRALIIKKFGTLSNFSDLSGYDRYELQKVFGLKEPGEKLKNLYELARITTDPIGGGKVTPKLIELMKSKINGLGGVAKFCSDNPQYKVVTVYQILSGRKKNVRGTVRDLVNTLKITIK